MRLPVLSWRVTGASFDSLPAGDPLGHTSPGYRQRIRCNSADVIGRPCRRRHSSSTPRSIRHVGADSGAAVAGTRRAESHSRWSFSQETPPEGFGEADSGRTLASHADPTLETSRDALGRRPRNRQRRHIGQVARQLPSDGGIGIEHPIEDRHVPSAHQPRWASIVVTNVRRICLELLSGESSDFRCRASGCPRCNDRARAAIGRSSDIDARRPPTSSCRKSRPGV